MQKNQETEKCKEGETHSEPFSAWHLPATQDFPRTSRTVFRAPEVSSATQPPDTGTRAPMKYPDHVPVTKTTAQSTSWLMHDSVLRLFHPFNFSPTRGSCDSRSFSRLTNHEVSPPLSGQYTLRSCRIYYSAHPNEERDTTMRKQIRDCD